MNEPKPADEQRPAEAEIRGGDRPSDYIQGPVTGTSQSGTDYAFGGDDDNPGEEDDEIPA